MLASTALLFSLTASALSLTGSAPGDPLAGGSADICTAGTEFLCNPMAGESDVERTVYATPAEVDCRAAVATVALNSRADLQLESGDCTPMTADYRFHVSRVPDSASSWPVAAPQRTRKSARTGSAISACRGVPEPTPPALVVTGWHPLALVSTPALTPPTATANDWVATALRRGRGFDPPDEPPRI